MPSRPSASDDLSPKEIIEQALAKHEDITYKRIAFESFLCPECGSELTVDRLAIKVDPAGITHMSKAQILVEKPSEGDCRPGFNGVGRQDLIREIARLRAQIKYLETEVQNLTKAQKPKLWSKGKDLRQAAKAEQDRLLKERAEREKRFREALERM